MIAEGNLIELPKYSQAAFYSFEDGEWYFNIRDAPYIKLSELVEKMDRVINFIDSQFHRKGDKDE